MNFSNMLKLILKTKIEEFENLIFNKAKQFHLLLEKIIEYTDLNPGKIRISVKV